MSTILVDNLTGKTSAGDITVTSEGGAATQSLQQGLAKAWINFEASTPSTRDSFNHSAITDNGTGNFTLNFSSAFASADRSSTTCSGYRTTAIAYEMCTKNTPTTTAQEVWLYYSPNGAVNDTPGDNMMTSQGDLA